MVQAMVSKVANEELLMSASVDDETDSPSPEKKAEEPIEIAPEIAADGKVVEGTMAEVFGELRSTLDADIEGDRRYLREGDDVGSDSFPVSRKLLATAAMTGLLVGVPYLVPGLERLRVLTPKAPSAKAAAPALRHQPMADDAIGEGKLPGATIDDQDRAADLETKAIERRGPIAQNQRKKLAAVPIPGLKDLNTHIERPEALKKFFDKLMKVEGKEPGQQARIMYYGDSIVASDFITGKLRRSLQDRFGDAGHGYAIVANAWPGWFHIDVSRQATSDWRVSTCVGPYAKDGLYGLGCASFTSYNPGNWTRFATATKAKWGQKVSSFEIEYLKQPKGGKFEVIVDGKVKDTVSTLGDEKALAYHRVEVEDGKHSLKVKAIEKKPVRVYGVRMERDVPGVILTASGITGARARFLDKQDDAHWARAMKQGKSDLVVLAFGSNEVTDGRLYPMEKFRETLSAVMDQVEKANPNASFMLAGPPDVAIKAGADGCKTRQAVKWIIENQQIVAKERGWAYWNQFKQMGGTGSMCAWITAGLGSDDMFHPTGRGGNMLGHWEYLAILEAYEKHKAAQ